MLSGILFLPAHVFAKFFHVLSCINLCFTSMAIKFLHMYRSAVS